MPFYPRFQAVRLARQRAKLLLSKYTKFPTPKSEQRTNVPSQLQPQRIDTSIRSLIGYKLGFASYLFLGTVRVFRAVMPREDVMDPAVEKVDEDKHGAR